ncbi:hypothetical protein AYI70_g6015 [Smittium culicis]|uniref:Uncharacterized protein n=1 Tax=Smittium culicis TaxID=133412 RepID=A0A1R1XRS6_9FUNG|nr:hypothetical protein AYI70_g6015 [Smittium culicis]
MVIIIQAQTLKVALENLQGTSNPSIQDESSTLESIYTAEGESYKYGSWDLSPDNQAGLFVEESRGISQDLFRLALHYAQKWGNSRRASIRQISGYDIDIATADPGTDMPEHQYLFHLSALEKMEISIQSIRNEKLLRQALSSKTSNNYPRQFHNHYQPNPGNTKYRGRSQARWGNSSKWNQTGQNSNYRGIQGNGSQLRENQSSLGYKPNIRLTNIRNERTGEDTPAVGYDVYQRILHKGNFQDGRSSIRHRENVCKFDPGKNKEDKRESPQSHSPPGNGVTSNGINHRVFCSRNCNRSCCDQVKGASNRHSKRYTEAQLKLQRTLFTFRTNIDQYEAAGHPIKPSKLVAIDAETLKSEITRTCYNECF